MHKYTERCIKMYLIILKAKANTGWEDGKLITILQIEGDPLNIDASGQCDLEVEVTVPASTVQESQEPVDTSDAGVAHRKWKLADGSHAQLDCLSYEPRVITCEGPECRKFAGTEYDKCPYASKKE